MNRRSPASVRAASLRVALAATLVAGVVYAVIALSVYAIASQELTTRVDQQLARAFEFVSHQPDIEMDLRPRPPGRSAIGPPLLVWTIDPTGAVTSETPDYALPTDHVDLTGSRTVEVNGEQVRVFGGTTGTGRLVVGQGLQVVTDAQGTLLLTELIVAPILLGVVFLSALVIGRRAAAPIERARQRQLDFTADASHELRTPVAVIEAQTSLALAQDRSPEWYRGAFERVGHETGRMRTLLDDLLWLARFDAGTAPARAEPMDVGVVAEIAVDRFAIVAAARNLTLGLVVTGASHAVNAPADWVDRLLGVLLDNACKYSPEGGAVRVTVGTDAGRVRLGVDDSGPGIDPAERERIFDRFHRATDSAGGAGLGLAIADAIVRATNGRWTIGTAPDGGASISVSWPAAT